MNANDFKLKMKLKMMDDQLTQDLITNWDKYKEKLQYKNLTLEEKEAFLKLFYVEYINGRNLLNIFYNLPKTIYKYSYRLLFKKYPNIIYTDVKLHFFPLKYIYGFLLKM